MQETAVREVREETGAWASIKGELKNMFFSVKGEQVKVWFFLMEALEEGKPIEHGREHTWLPLDKALSRTSHKETQEVLSLAERGHSELGEWHDRTPAVLVSRATCATAMRSSVKGAVQAPDRELDSNPLRLHTRQ